MAKKRTKRIAWLTPLGPRSDVGAHSLAVTEAMQRRADAHGCEVVVFINPNGPTYRSSAANIVMGDAFDAGILSLFDVAFLNIGNNQENHGIINEVALRRPGVVVVHDFTMQHYVAWKAFEQYRRPNLYVDMMCQHYGVAGLDVIHRSRIGLEDRSAIYAPWDSPHVEAMPLLEPFLQKSTAIVVHSQFASETVAKFSSRPQLKLFLPADKKPAPKRAKSAAGARTRFVIFGHISRTKHIELCMDALGASPMLRARATLQIAGGANDPSYVRELQNRIQEAGLKDAVQIAVNVTEQQLLALKSEADIFINIRFPNTESASGSLAEQMACGKPVIVYDSGSYREVDDGCVVKIDDIGSPQSLMKAMEALAADEDLRTAIGDRALAYVEERTAAAYAERVLEFAAEQPSGQSGRDPVAAARDKRLSNLVPAADANGPGEVAFNLARYSAPDAAERPQYTAIESLDLASTVKYLELSVFRAGASKATSECMMLLLSQAERKLWPLVVGRVAFLCAVVRASLTFRAVDLDPENDVIALALLAAANPALLFGASCAIVLGRAPFPAELALPAVLDGGAGAALRNFSLSAECARRPLPRDARRAFADMAGRLDALPIRDRAPPPVLRPGDRVGDEAVAGLLGFGWHEVEPEGAWSSVRSAALHFRLALPKAEKCRLSLELRLAWSGDMGARELAVALNGRDGVRLSVGSKDRMEVAVPIHHADPERNILILTLNELVRISDHEPGGDVRRLGVFLYGLRVEAE